MHDTAKYFANIEQPANSNACWFWQGKKNNAGYGYFYTGRGKSGQTGAHRASWEIHHGKDFPADMDAMHSCDNKRCVNPLHLRPGPRKENIAELHERHPEKIPHGIARPDCKRKHGWENVYVSPSGSRHCRECRRLHDKKRGWRR